MIDQPKPHTLDEFQQNIEQHLARMKHTGEPELLTVGGRAEVVVYDLDSHQKLLGDLELAQSIAGIRRGLEQAERGEVRPIEDVFADLETRAKANR